VAAALACAHESSYGRTWHAARAAALGPDLTATPPARRPYNLRHAALSLWLASGAPPAEIAARAGHSIHLLLSVYVHCVPRHNQITDQAIEHALALPRAGTRLAEHRRADSTPCGPQLAHEIL
jgi:integrase